MAKLPVGLHIESGWADAKRKGLSRREQVLLDPLAASDRSDRDNKLKEFKDNNELSDWIKGQLGFGS